MKVVSPPAKVDSPPVKVVSPAVKVISPPAKIVSPPTKTVSPPMKNVSPPTKVASPPVNIVSISSKVVSPPTKVVFPPTKPKRVDSKHEETAIAPRSVCREHARDGPIRSEKLSLVAAEADGPNESADLPPPELDTDRGDDAGRSDEANGVGDKIKIFEKAAEDAATAGRASRPGSVRRPRAERLPSDELPPPPASPELPAPPPERAPQRIVRPEFRPLASPAEVTIRSPSLGAKAPERFPSRGTAFRNVAASPAPAPPPDAPSDADEAPDALKACKSRGRERPTASRGSSYFTRGSEEIWLVKKKDIEEIEERVLDSFRRAGAGAGVGAGAGTCGRRGYGRSESLEAARGAGEWPGRAHTLKRQASVACTCGHDKKTRVRNADTTPRPRSRSHGEPTDATVLDKYETLV